MGFINIGAIVSAELCLKFCSINKNITHIRQLLFMIIFPIAKYQTLKREIWASSDGVIANNK